MTDDKQHISQPGQGARIPRQAVGALLVAVLDHLPYGILLLGERRQVLHANAAARALVAGGEVLALSDASVSGAGATNEAALRRGLDAVRAAPRASGRGRTVAFVLAAVEGTSWLHVVGATLSDPTRPRVIGTALFISGPAQSAPLDARAVADLFQISRAEANLAVRLAAGATLSAAAAALGISVNTARKQLRAAFAKTGVTRQADLQRVLLGSVAFLLARPRMVQSDH